MFCKIVAPSSDIHKLPEVPKSYKDLHSLVTKKFRHEVSEKFFLKYKDSEEELITLCNDDDLQTAIVTNQSENIKTLRIFIIPDNSPSKRVEEKTIVSNPKEKNKEKEPTQKASEQKNKEALEINDYVGALDYISSDPGKIYDENIDLRKIYEQLPLALDLKRSMSHNPQTETERNNIAMYESIRYMDPREMFEKIPPRLTSPSIPEEIMVQDYFNDGQVKAVIKLIEQKVKERIEEKVQTFSNELLSRFQEEAKNLGLLRNSNANMRNIGLPFGSRMAMRRGKDTQEEAQIQECSQCNETIMAIRYTCLTCKNFICCEKCENTINHAHPLLKIRFAKGGGGNPDDGLPPMMDLSRSSSKIGMFQRMNSSVEVGEQANISEPIRYDELNLKTNPFKRNSVAQNSEYSAVLNKSTVNMQNKNGKTIYSFGYQSEISNQKGRQLNKAATSINLPNPTISPIPQTSSKQQQVEREFKQYKVALIKPPVYEVTTVRAGHPYHISFTIKNNGDSQWPETVKLVCVEGNHKNEEVSLPSLEAGKNYIVDLHLEAPWELGRFFNEWKVYYAKDGGFKTFGKEISIEIEVVESDKAEKEKAKRDKEKEKLDKASEKEYRGRGDSFNLADKLNTAEEDKKLMKEFDCSEQVLKHAKVIQDLMCAGTLKEKIEFMKACAKDWDLNQIVSAYLTWINNPNKLKNMVSTPQ